MGVGSCVGWDAIFVETTYIDHADGVGVVPLAVSADLFDATTCLYCSIEFDYKMVPDTIETSGFVPSVYFHGVHVSTSLCGRAVHDNFIYPSHDSCREGTFGGLHQFRVLCNTLQEIAQYTIKQKNL